MKKYFLVLFSVFLLFSCDDGDLIVTNFDFDERTIQTCAGTENRQVFFKLNNDLSNEAIALVFTLTPESEDFLIEERTDPLVLSLNTQNQVIYRTFNGQVDADYFCNEIPPTSPQVVEEYRSTSGGEIVIYSTRRNADDHDQDGVPTAVEIAVEAEYYVGDFPDTDGDGIPDYLDIDDDNDNVRTSVEIAVTAESTANGLPDTDGDGIPDYRDEDDDNDGIISRYEDWNQNQNPTDDVNDDNLPYYRNPDINDRFEVDAFIPNNISIGYTYDVYIQNLTLVRQGGDGEQITLEEYDFGSLNSPQVSFDLLELLEEED